MPPAPAPVGSVEDAAVAYDRDGLFWMRDVLSDTDVEALGKSSKAHFYEVLRALMVKQALNADGEPPPARRPAHRR